MRLSYFDLIRSGTIILITWIFPLVLFAQKKYEKESDLSLKDVPAKAILFFDTAPISGEIDWYYEENLLGNSIEAKFYHREQKYSIEFDVNGELQDIEVECGLGDVDIILLTNMTESLSKEFMKSNIIRVQQQYRGTILSFLDFLNEPDKSHVYQLKYETEVKAKKKKRSKLYEVLFGQEGKIERIDEVIFRNNDYLEF